MSEEENKTSVPEEEGMNRRDFFLKLLGRTAYITPLMISLENRRAHAGDFTVSLFITLLGKGKYSGPGQQNPSDPSAMPNQDPKPLW